VSAGARDWTTHPSFSDRPIREPNSTSSGGSTGNFGESRDEPSARHSPVAFNHGRVRRKRTPAQARGPGRRGIQIRRCASNDGISPYIAPRSFAGPVSGLFIRARNAIDWTRRLQFCLWSILAGNGDMGIETDGSGIPWDRVRRGRGSRVPAAGQSRDDGRVPRSGALALAAAVDVPSPSALWPSLLAYFA